jgi:hypothetical protein
MSHKPGRRALIGAGAGEELARGDVGDRADRPHRATVLEEGLGAGRQPAQLAVVAAADPVDHVVAAVAGGVVGPGDRGGDRRSIFGHHLRDDLAQGHRFVGAPTEMAPHARRPEDLIRAVVVVEEPDPGELGHLVEQIGQRGRGQGRDVRHHHLGPGWPPSRLLWTTYPWLANVPPASAPRLGPAT